MAATGHVRADYPGAFQEGDVLVGESEILDSVKDASGTGYDAVAAAFGQTAGNNSKTQRRLAVPDAMAASTMVSS